MSIQSGVMGLLNQVLGVSVAAKVTAKDKNSLQIEQKSKDSVNTKPSNKQGTPAATMPANDNMASKAMDAFTSLDQRQKMHTQQQKTLNAFRNAAKERKERILGYGS